MRKPLPRASCGRTWPEPKPTSSWPRPNNNLNSWQYAQDLSSQTGPRPPKPRCETKWRAPWPKPKKCSLGRLLLFAAQKAHGITLGAYDFAGTLSNKLLAIDETFVNQVTGKGWINSTTEENVYDFAMSAKAKRRMPLITIEPR